MTINISPRQLCRVRPFTRIKLRVSRRHRMSGNPENGMKRGHRIKSAIEPENKLVEIGLQMLWLDTAMMSSLKPSFQVAEDEVDHGQVRFCFIRVATKRQNIVTVSHFGKSGITGPSVSAHDSASCHVLFDEVGKHFGAPVRNDTKPQPPRINAAPVLLAVILARADLNGANDESLMMNAAPFTARLAANEAFVDLDGMLPADCVSFGPDHAGAQFVQNLKCRFVTAKSELALELDSRLSGDLRGHQVRAPKPRRKWRMARLHDRSGRQRGVDLAATATKHDRRARGEAVGLPGKPAFRTRKPIRPTHGFEIASARFVVGEDPLKLRKRSGEAANVHGLNISRSPRPCQATG
jgi:hypothetical protein